MGKFGGLRARVTPHMMEVLDSSLKNPHNLPVIGTDEQFVEVAELRRLCAANTDSVSLHDVLKGSELCMPPLPKRERNPELVARLERIKANLAHREYEQLVGNVSSKDNMESLGQQYRQVTLQTTVVFNSFLTVIGAFVFAFFAVRYIGLDVIAQVSSGLFCGMLVFFADLYFIMRDEYGKERGPPPTTTAALAGPLSQPPAAIENLKSSQQDDR